MHEQAPVGIRGIAVLPWGTHYCHFYDSHRDLAHALVPYFKAGLENNDACLWVTSEPLGAADARAALAAVTPDLGEREARGQIEIVDHDNWYLRAGNVAAESTLQCWIDRERSALARGYTGLRLSGNTAWLEQRDWAAFVAYERLVNDTFHNHRILALCSYCLGRCSGPQVLDAVATHQCVAVCKDEVWRIIESSSHEITRRELFRTQQVAEALRLADRRKDQFIAVLGHELRNPLAPIASAVEILRRRGSLPEAYHLDIIDRQVQHMNMLVDDLLDLSRIARGALRLHKDPTPLRDVLTRSIELVTPHMQRRRHRFEVDDGGSDVVIDGDAGRLVQVFGNVLANAAKYTAFDGHIMLTVEQDSTHVTVTVRDNGFGIPEDVLPHVFEPFVQGERAVSRQGGGLGLGLSIVKSLVELHDGTVEIASSGTGTAVMIRLPITAMLCTDRPLVPRAAARSGENRRLLIVDDNRDVAALFREVLEELEYDVRIAANARAALEIAERWHPEIAIIDIGLPGMNGYELAGKLRAMPELQRMQLIAVTGYGTAADRGRAEQAGFDHHLTKPVDIAVLTSVLWD